MKKLILLLILCFLMCGCDLDRKEKPTEAPTEEPTAVPTDEPTEIPTEAPADEPTEEPADISDEEKVIRQRIDDEYYLTVIDSIAFNPDLGTEDENDCIALVYLTWKVKNSEETSKEMLKMYSDDLAVYVGENAPAIQEIAIFWTIPYLDATAKYSYERKDDGMYLMDEAWS